MRGATLYVGDAFNLSAISTHTPHAGRDDRGRRSNGQPAEFLLTRPMRGATLKLMPALRMFGFLLTRPMRGATGESRRRSQSTEFLLTRPMRGATML